MPYQDQYDDPVPPSRGLSENKARLAGQYARGLVNSDKALAKFFADLKQDKEKTAVVFYGDHLPAQIYPPDLTTREGNRRSHETPWLIWNNRGSYEHTKLPTLSPTHLFPKLFEASNAPIPPMYALLADLEKQVPAMDVGLRIGSDDEVLKQSELTDEQRRVLADYRLVQYDLSIGKRYSADVLFGDPPR